jgi:hypothetical protein
MWRMSLWAADIVAVAGVLVFMGEPAADSARRTKVGGGCGLGEFESSKFEDPSR